MTFPQRRDGQLAGHEWRLALSGLVLSGEEREAIKHRALYPGHKPRILWLGERERVYCHECAERHSRAAPRVP